MAKFRSYDLHVYADRQGGVRISTTRPDGTRGPGHLVPSRLIPAVVELYEVAGGCVTDILPDGAPDGL